MHRRAFSQFELLVILVMLAITIGLLLPVVMQTREADKRVRSLDNLKKIGLAIHSFHDANNGRFPYLCDYGSGAPTPNATSGGGGGVQSAFFQILPQIEGATTYVKYLTREPRTYYHSEANKPSVAATVFKPYIDPADFTAPEGMTGTADVLAQPAGRPYEASFKGTYATTSYALNGMLFTPGAGIKTLLSGDGASTTIMIAQRYQKCDLDATGRNAQLTMWGLGAFSASTASFSTAPPSGVHPRADKTQHRTGSSALDQWVPPNIVPATGDLKGKAGGKEMAWAAIGATSFAPGGFQVAPRGKVFCDPRIPQTPQTTGMVVGLGDASTRTVANNISPNTFWSAVTPHGTEELGSDW